MKRVNPLESKKHISSGSVLNTNSNGKHPITTEAQKILTGANMQRPITRFHARA